MSIASGIPRAKKLYVGVAGGDGSTIQTGGVLQLTYDLYVGRDTDCTGYYELQGGTIDTYYEYVGRNGTGLMRQSGGRDIIDDWLVLGYSDNSDGTFELSGTGRLTGNRLYLGGFLGAGTGRFVQTGGTANWQNAYFGYISGSKGTYELGQGYLSSVNETIGMKAAGTFHQTGGTHTVSGDLKIGDTSGSNGDVELSGGTLTAGEILVGTGDGTGSFKVAGGDASITVLTNLLIGQNGDLVSEIRLSGITKVSVSGNAILEGEWTVLTDNAQPGRYDILQAGSLQVGGLTGVELPGADWLWGVQGNTLWVEYIPEPATMSLLAAGSLLAFRRRKRFN